MAHSRKLIRQAVVTLLKAANTGASTRVKGTRVDPLTKKLPAMGVYTLNDPVNEDTSSGSEDVHDLQVEVAGWVPHTDAVPADDAMDDLAEQIEAAMNADRFLGGLAGGEGARLKGTVMQIVEVDGRSDPQVGIVVLTYLVEYQADLTATAATDDFLRAEVTYPPVNAVDDTVPAEDAIAIRLWDIDGMSGKAVPATSAEWAAFLADAGVTTGGPKSIYSFQDFLSPIRDANALHDLPGIGNSHYRTPISGWARLGAGHDYVASDNGFVKQHGSLPPPDTNSYLLLAYATVLSDPGTESGIMSVNDSAVYGGIDTGTRFPTCGAGTRTSTGGAAIPLNQVLPYLLRMDIANTCEKFYTPFEIICRDFTLPAPGTAEIDWGVALASSLFAADAEYLYGALFTGPAAEKTDEEIGDILIAGNWSPTWAIAPVADSGNGKYFPLALQQWTALDIAPPVATWSLQESAGVVFANYVGDYFLIKAGSNFGLITHSATVSGQTRKGLAFVNGTGEQEIKSTDARLPNLTTTSMALLMTAKVTAATPAGGAFAPYKCWMGGIGTTQNISIHIGATGIFGLDVGTSHYDGSVAQLNTNTPILLVYDVTGSRIVLYTAGEKLSVTYANQGGGSKGAHIGSNSINVPCPDMVVSHAAVWSGYVAEMSDATARELFANLGWSVPW